MAIAHRLTIETGAATPASGSTLGAMKVRVDYHRCTGVAACEQVCPEVFQIREDGLAEVIDLEPHETLWECVRRAQEACPEEAIVVEDGE